MTRTRALAAAFDRRFPLGALDVPTPSQGRQPPRAFSKYHERGEDFWRLIRLQRAFMSWRELAAHHGVPLSTAKHWSARAYRGTP